MGRTAQHFLKLLEMKRKNRKSLYFRFLDQENSQSSEPTAKPEQLSRIHGEAYGKEKLMQY